MDVVIFFYTMVVFVCALFVSAVSLSAYIVTRQKTFALAAAAYFFYFFDVTLVFRTAYVHPQSSEGSALYTITSPVESVLLGAGVFGCLWTLECKFLDRPMRTAKIAVAVFVLASVISYFAIGDPRVREFVFFSMRSLAMLAMVVFAAWAYLRAPDQMEHDRLLTHLPLALYMFVGALGTIVWNLYFLYLRPALRVEGAPPFMPERNFVENVLILGIGFWFVRVAVRRLQLFHERVPAGSTPARERFLEDEVRLYASRSGLSEREEQIFTEIMRGKTYSAIASDLYISPSTVKVHVHNILQKTSNKNRDELVRDFWHGV